MSKNSLVIILGSILISLSLLTVFVFKARGSNSRELISGCIPYNVSISKGREYQAVVEWRTVDECLGYISYGNRREKLDSIALDTQELSGKEHRVVIEGLLPSQSYFLIINSGDKSYGSKGVPLSFSLSSL